MSRFYSIFDDLKTLITILAITLFLGCAQTDRLEVNTSEYSDINAFVKAEIDWLNKSHSQLIKHTTWQDQFDLDTSSKVDWEKELYAFLEIDIKQAIWKTDFELTDSVILKGNTIRTFKTTNERQRIRRIEITTSSDSIVQFDAEIRDQNKLTTSNQRISLTKHMGYSLIGNRKTKVLGDENYHLIGQYYHTNN